MSFSDEYDFKNVNGGSGSKPTAQDFLQNKLYKQMSEQGNFDPTPTSSTPKVPQSKRSDDGMIDSQIYNAFNENNFDKSQQKFNSINRARQASAAADETVNSMDSFKGLRQSVVDQSDYYEAAATQRTAGLFGDVWNVQSPPNWRPPANPS